MAKGSVLIVEDEGLVALDVSRRVKKLGYQVAGVAADGVTALECARDQSPDVIMMDIKIGGDRDGIEVAQEITELYDIPVVYLTAFSDEKTMERARSAAPYGYLVKPINDQEMDTALEIATHRHRLEQSLRLSRQRFLDLVESTEDWVWEIDSDGVVMYSNPQSVKITGLESSQMIGAKLTSVMRESSEAEIESLLGTNDLTSRLDSVVSWIDTLEGERAIETNANPVIEKEKIVGWRGISRDITDRVKLDNELRRLLGEHELLAQSLERFAKSLRPKEVVSELLDLVLGLNRVELAVLYCEQYRGTPVVGGAEIPPSLRDSLERCSSPQEITRAMRNDGLNPCVMPLMSGEELIAVLVISSVAQEQPIDPSSERMAKLFVKQAVITLQNALAYEHQLKISTTLQESLRPDLVGQEQYHVASAYESATRGALIGGDFIDLTTLQSGKLGIFVGDVSGKGLEASLDTASLQYTLRASLGLVQSPGEALSLLNETVGPRFKSGRFSTLFAGIIDRENELLTYSIAGHPDQLILREDGTVHEVGKVRGPAIGMFRGITYKDDSVQFTEGDTLWLFTDGVLEARDPSSNRGEGLFGMARLKDLIVAVAGLDVEVQVETVLHGIKMHTGGHFTDDMALLAFSFR